MSIFMAGNTAKITSELKFLCRWCMVVSILGIIGWMDG